jgi:mannose-6-phosphate isomerase
VNCNYFTTNFIPLDGIISVNKNGNSFTVYMCVDGNFEIEVNETSYHYKKGDTVLIPATLTQYKMMGKGSVLEIYIS